MEYNKELCESKHKTIDDKLNDHEERLDKHEEKIEGLQIKEGIHQIEINQLCVSINNLVNTTKWFIGLTITSLGGFFIYAIEKVIFK